MRARLLLLVPLTLAACGEPSAPAGVAADATAGARQDIDTDTLAADLAAGRVPVLIDVRSDGEFRDGHVKGAINIPVEQLESRFAELERFRGGPIYVICEVGGRSARAADRLAEHGFRAINVDGGTAAWRRAGRELDVGV